MRSSRSAAATGTPASATARTTTAAASFLAAFNDATTTTIDDYYDEEDDSILIELWERLITDCKEESFNFIFSVLSIILAISAFLTDCSNYYLSILFRVITIVLLPVALLFLILIPSACAQFSGMDNVLIQIRVTLFHAVWFINHYRRLTERKLTGDYSNSLQSVTEVVLTSEGGGGRKKTKGLPREHAYTTPDALFNDLQYMRGFLLQRGEFQNFSGSSPQQVTSQKQVVKRNVSLLVGDEDEASMPHHHHPTPPQPTDKESLVSPYMTKMADLNYKYITLLSWKNRTFGKNLLRLIDLSQALWILLVCSWWLWLVPLEFLWLLYCVHTNTNEIESSNNYATMISLYTSTESQNIYDYLI